MARKTKVVQKEISEEISDNHPNKLEGNLSESQENSLEKLRSKVCDEKLTNKDKEPLNITQLYNSHYAELVGKAVKNNLETLAINLTGNDVRKALKYKKIQEENKDSPKKGNVKAITGFVVGSQGVFDKIKNMQSQLRNLSGKYSTVELRHKWTDSKGKEHQPLINEKNELLDQREKMFGKPNPDYLKPLKASTVDASHTLRVIAKIIGTDKWVETTLQTNDRNLAYGWTKVPMYTPFSTYANVKGEAKEEGEAEDITFSSSSAEETKSTFKALKDDSIDVDTVFREMTDGLITPLEKLEDEHKLQCDDKGKLPFDAVFWIEGIVTGIYTDRKDSRGRITMGLMSREDNGVEIKVKLPSWITITWGEGSFVRVNGKTEYGVRKDGDEWIQGDIQLSAYGVYAYPEECTPAPEAASEEPLEDEENLNAWEA